MTWPGITDFSEAIQNPSLCFEGTELEAATVAVNQRGTPLVFSGAFASVYSVSVAGRTFAVRCFTREVKDQEARYNELSNYLINVLPPSFVHFEYLDEGIRFKDGWYPIVKMEWVAGEVLSSFVGARLGEPDTLRRVAAQWRGGPAASLRGLRIAHNDLQHGNVMVQSDGRIRLVDYDGMFLPKFSGERSPELGHKNYQHPERSADDYGEYIDNFPSLVIYLSLLAVASDPNLWHFYNDDNLIFTRSDYAEPGKSEVFQRLKSSSDATVAKLAESLEECCAMPVDDVPDLEAILRSIPQFTAVAPQAAPTSPKPPGAAAATPSPPQPASASASSGAGYRQLLGGQPATSRPASSPTSSAPSSSPTQPQTIHSVVCSNCNNSNAPTANSCIHCGVGLRTPASSVVGLSKSQPRTSSQRGTFAQMRQNFSDSVAELRLNAAYYEFKKVALGVGIIAASVLVLLVTVMVWEILRNQS